MQLLHYSKASRPLSFHSQRAGLGRARALVSEGAGELILVAQETTLYGTDLYKKKALAELLAELSEIPNLHWIRILYCYPEE